MITEKRIPFHVDNLYLRKQLNDEYQEVFDRLYDYLEKDTKKSSFDKNVILNIALQQCLEGIREKKKANLVIPKDLKNYVMKYGRGPVFKEMKKKLRDQDYEKLIISSIWLVFTISIVLLFIGCLINQKFFVNYYVDLIAACIAGALAFQNYKIKRRVIQRYTTDSFFLRLDMMTILSCIFIKVMFHSNFDVTYLILVISFLVMKRKVKPIMEQAV